MDQFVFGKSWLNQVRSRLWCPEKLTCRPSSLASLDLVFPGSRCWNLWTFRRAWCWGSVQLNINRFKGEFYYKKSVENHICWNSIELSPRCSCSIARCRRTFPGRPASGCRSWRSARRGWDPLPPRPRSWGTLRSERSDFIYHKLVRNSTRMPRRHFPINPTTDIAVCLWAVPWVEGAKQEIKLTKSIATYDKLLYLWHFPEKCRIYLTSVKRIRLVSVLKETQKWCHVSGGKMS